jgi:hypothetical protein
MSGVKATAAIAGGWLDLGTKSGLDNKLYEPLEEGGELESVHSKDLNPITYYSRLPVPLKKTGQSNNAQYAFAKTADFAGNTWYEFVTPDITIKEEFADDYRIAFTPNMGHNVAKTVTLLINEIPLVKFDAVTMDFLSEANLGAGQYEGYMLDIGNTTKALTFSTHLAPVPVRKLLHELFFVQKNRPAPQDNFPLCAAKHNSLSLQIDFVESLEDVIRVRRNTAVSGAAVWTDADPKSVNLSTIVTVSGSNGLAMPMPDVWCEYSVVLKEERDAFQAAPIDLVIKQIQTFTGPKVGVGSVRQPFNFAYPTRALYFGARNVTASAKRNFSNYTTKPEDEAGGLDPIRTATLWYDNNTRIQNMPGDYFSGMEFQLHAARRPAKKGIHLLAYCEDTTSSEIDCTTNYSKLSTDLEVNIVELSTDSDDAATTASQYQLELRSEVNNLIRFEGGVVAFPTY